MEQAVKRMPGIVVGQRFLREIFGEKRIIGVEVIRIQDGDITYDLSFNSRGIKAICASRKGKTVGSIGFGTYYDDPEQVISVIDNDNKCTIIGAKNNEPVQKMIVFGIPNEDGVLDSALHLNLEDKRLSVMSHNRWAYFKIEKDGLKQVSLEKFISHQPGFTQAYYESDPLSVEFSDACFGNSSKKAQHHEKQDDIKSKKNAVLGALGRLPIAEQHRVLDRFMAVMRQSVKEG